MKVCYLIAFVTLMSLFYSGNTLKCFECNLGFWNLCHTTKTNCSGDQVCYVGIGKAASVLDIKVKGCLPTDECNKTTLVEFLSNNTLYTMKTSCCDKDLCNAGPALQFPLTLLSFTVLIIVQMNGSF